MNVLAALVLASATADRPLAIRATRVLLGDGRTIENGVVLVEGGKVQSVGTETDVDVPEGAGRIDHPGWLSAGLIALRGYSGSIGELRDSTRSEMPEARIVWAFDPEHPEFGDLLSAGITSLVLTPSPQSLVGGASAVVKCSTGRVLAREAQLVLGFSDQNLAINRFPTSHMGGRAQLDKLFEKPTGTLERCKSGEIPVLLEVVTRPDVARAVDFARKHRLNGALSGADWTGELAKEVKESGLSVVCAPIGVGEDRRTLRATLALAAADVPFGFGLDAPWSHPATLRFAAALCVREGLEPARAWQALSSEPARIAGVADHVGRIEAGLDADLVLWSGDPLDLASSVQAVYVDGKRVRAGETR